jgi:Ribonuclease H2 non-catalytic subunit (Ylr154p-like)
MTGEVIKLPKDYRGVVALQSGQSKKDDQLGDVLQWHPIGTFDAYMNWKPDQYIHENRKVQQSMETWIGIASALHDTDDADMTDTQ